MESELDKILMLSRKSYYLYSDFAAVDVNGSVKVSKWKFLAIFAEDYLEWYKIFGPGFGLFHRTLFMAGLGVYCHHEVKKNGSLSK